MTRWSMAIAACGDAIDLAVRLGQALMNEEDRYNERQESMMRAAHLLELKAREQSWLYARLVTDRQERRRREPSSPPLFCLCCKRWLKPIWPGQPSGALSFSGGGHYGSAYDQEQSYLGVDGYKFFICDICWPSVRHLAIGTRKRPPPPPVIEHVDGEQLDAAACRLYGEREPGARPRP